MPAPRGVKRSASKASDVTASSSVPKSKKKRGVIQLEIPKLPTVCGSVFACGQGDVGQLGLGEDVMELTKFRMIPELGNNIVSICAGGMHSVALDKDGVVWTFGCNDEGALGREGSEWTPAAVRLPAAAVAVSAGDSHSAALLHDGTVYAWGSFRDSHGSMGLVVLGRAGKPSREPVRVLVPEPAVELASGSDHLVVLTTLGSVYTLGCGEQGQLGRLSQRSASRDARHGFSALLQPGKVTLKGGATRVWAGHHATLALCPSSPSPSSSSSSSPSSPCLVAWGLNNYSQLGVSGEKRRGALYSATVADTLQDAHVKAAALGQHHTLLLTDVLYALGRCEYGRLGLGGDASDALVPLPVPLAGAAAVACGTSSSYACTWGGGVLAWGMGSEGQLGTGGAADEPAPRAVDLRAPPAHRARIVAAGGQHALVLTEDTSLTNAETPQPDVQTEEQTTDVKESAEPPAKKERKPNKRQKKADDDEVTSTSADGETAPTQKVNGKDKDIAMDVDDTDNKRTDAENKQDDSNQTTTEQKNQESTDKQKTPQPESKPKSMDQEPTETTPEPTEDKPTTKAEVKDVEMKDINGTDNQMDSETAEKPLETVAVADKTDKVATKQDQVIPEAAVTSA